MTTPWLDSITREVESPFGNIFITVGFHEGEAVEIIVVHGKAGGRERANAQALGMIASEALQQGASLERIARKMRGISSEDAIGIGPQKIGSLPDAVAQGLEEIMEDIRE